MSILRELREKLNELLFDKWKLGAPKTPRLEVLSLRERRILDWHFLRMNAFGVAVPIVFLTTFKPAPPPKRGLVWRSAHPGYVFMFFLWPFGVAFYGSLVWTRTWIGNMNGRAAAVDYLRKDGGTFGYLGIPKRDRESDVALGPQGRRFE